MKNLNFLVITGIVATCSSPGVAQPAETATPQPSTASTPQPVESSATGTRAVGTITGEGNGNRIPRFTGPNTIGNSIILQKDGQIGIGTDVPTSLLTVVGSSTKPAILGKNPTSGSGVRGTSASGAGVYGQSAAAHTITAPGVYGRSTGDGGIGVIGEAPTGNAWGVYGIGNAVGVYGVGNGFGTGVSGTGNFGVSGQSNTSAVGGAGVYGSGDNGVYGTSSIGTGSGIYGINTGTGYAGYFVGKVYIGGALEKPAGSFKIDHPLDPANKYLSHSFVESPDMMNIYNGNVKLDRKGQAIVQMPAYFTALNHDFRYQLTAIGAPGPNLYVAQEIMQGHFKIAGGKPGTKVSWQVTGVRQDAYARDHRIKVEQDKGKERGFYLYPAGFGQPENKIVGFAQRPASKPRVAASPKPR